MTTSLSALPSSLANLLTNYASSGPQADGTTAATPQAAPTPAGGALGTDPAYTLKLGAQGSSTALLGYSRLATLGSQFESAISPLESSAGSSGQGGGAWSATATASTRRPSRAIVAAACKAAAPSTSRQSSTMVSGAPLAAAMPPAPAMEIASGVSAASAMSPAPVELLGVSERRKRDRAG